MFTPKSRWSLLLAIPLVLLMVGVGARPSTASALYDKAVPCTITFTDVHPDDYFYEAVTYLYCHGVVTGYDDNTFAPYNDVTRAQMTKMVVLGFNIPLWNVPSTGTATTFSDVPRTDTFYRYIETAYRNGIVSGYADGTFRPYAHITRGQLSKIVVQAAMKVNGWPMFTYPMPVYVDVQPDNAFYIYIETAYCHNIISGYSDGTFRPSANATRGQVSKIVYLAIKDAGSCQSAVPLPNEPKP